MIRLLAHIDADEAWQGYTSKWSLLEVARALRKDRKPPALIDLNLRELRTHQLRLIDIDDPLLVAAQQLITRTNLYAADSLHVVTYRAIDRTTRLAGFLCDDRHFQRLREHVQAIKISQLSL